MSYAHGGGEREFRPVSIAILTVSDSRDELTDKSGRLLVERLTAAGHRLAEKRIVPDDIYQIRAVVSRWIADPDVNVIISTGGTGVTGRDGTPEAVAHLIKGRLRHWALLLRRIRFYGLLCESSLAWSAHGSADDDKHLIILAAGRIADRATLPNPATALTDLAAAAWPGSGDIGRRYTYRRAAGCGEWSRKRAPNNSNIRSSSGSTPWRSASCHHSACSSASRSGCSAARSRHSEKSVARW